MKQLFREISVGLLVLGSLLVSVPALASAQENTDTNNNGSTTNSGRPHTPGVFGTVSAINGSTITLQSKGRGPDAAAAPATTYTINAANAVVIKNGATSTLSSVAVGDMVSAQGAVNGTTVTATKLRDGIGSMRGGRGSMNGDQSAMMSSDGNPVIGGTVSAIKGSSLTITNRSGVTYTIDATNAKIEKDNSTSSISAIAVGDRVMVQGTTTGTSVVASSIIDRGVSHASPGVDNAAGVPQGDAGSVPSHEGGIRGFFGGIRNFFHHFFGFF
jgi:Domain of unknown function (DUF5666)